MACIALFIADVEKKKNYTARLYLLFQLALELNAYKRSVNFRNTDNLNQRVPILHIIWKYQTSLGLQSPKNTQQSLIWLRDAVKREK